MSFEALLKAKLYIAIALLITKFGLERVSIKSKEIKILLAIVRYKKLKESNLRNLCDLHQANTLCKIINKATQRYHYYVWPKVSL